MYSWYFPKDEASTGLGHRHDWEGVVVWLSDSTVISESNIVAVCPSAHGNWHCSTDGYTLDGTAPLIDYRSIWPFNHALGLTSTVGGTQPLIAWESMSRKFQKTYPRTSVPANRTTLQRSCKMRWIRQTLDRGMFLSMRITLRPGWQRPPSEQSVCYVFASARETSPNATLRNVRAVSSQWEYVSGDRLLLAQIAPGVGKLSIPDLCNL